MKRVLLIIWILFTLLLSVNYSYAATTVRVSENIPWLGCSQVKWSWQWEWESILRDCPVDKWANSIIKMLWKIVNYFTFIAWLFWVMFIVYNWILYSMSGLDEQLKSDAKKRITITLLGLVLLFLSWPFLELVAPWVYE